MHSSAGTRTPIAIEDFQTAIKDMSDDELERIKQEITNSIKHLQRSNLRLSAYVDKIHGKEIKSDELDDGELDNIDAEDLQLYTESLKENQTILDNYNKRIEALDQENIFRTSRTSHKAHSEPLKEPYDSKISSENSIYL